MGLAGGRFRIETRTYHVRLYKVLKQCVPLSMRVRSCSHRHVHAFIRACSHVQTHTNLHSCTDTGINTCMYIYTHTCMHECTQTSYIRPTYVTFLYVHKHLYTPIACCTVFSGGAHPNVWLPDPWVGGSEWCVPPQKWQNPDYVPGKTCEGALPD